MSRQFAFAQRPPAMEAGIVDCVESSIYVKESDVLPCYLYRFAMTWRDVIHFGYRNKIRHENSPCDSFSNPAGMRIASRHFHNLVTDQALRVVGEIALPDGFVLNRQILAQER